jgi:cellulose synthase/poly-beta-1,6-N-acetylglucosamine synthase-like glycosyltransferase
MEFLFYIFVYLLLFISALYVFVILCFSFGWIKTKGYVEIDDELSTKVSVIIAARNEEYTISSCLRALVNQSYPTANMEIIVVNDASEDTTAQHINRFCEQYTFIKHISLSGKNGEHGKKKALQRAMETATGEVIITTDADCIMGMDWMRILVSFYNKTKAELIAAPVCFNKEKSPFEKMQSLEFMALLASGGGALYYNKAILCNGANLLYTRKAFREVNGFTGIDTSPSGDDVLLMYKISKRFPGQLKFLKNEDAIVYTKAKQTVAGFMQQRKRWASKKFSTLNSETKAISLLVYTFNLLLIVLPFMAVFIKHHYICGLPFYKIWLLILLIKCVIDFLLVFLAASFFNKRKWLIFFIPEQLLYIPYVVYTGLLGLLGTYDWKGRKIKME